MKKSLLLAAAACTALSASAGLVTNKLDWCTVVVPDVWEEGPLPVEVTTNPDIPEGQQVGVHLLWMKKNNIYGGFLSWRPAQKAEPGKKLVFKHNPKPNEDMRSINVDIFLSPDGEPTHRISSGTLSVPLPPEPPYPERPSTVTFRNSFIWVEDPAPPTRVGEELVFKVHYKLDERDTWGPKRTSISCIPLGPWIDNPDGVINTKRHHVGYPGLHSKDMRIDPGEGVAEFKFKLGGAFRYNTCTFLCKFITPEGDDWPWDWRGGGLNVVPINDSFRMFPGARGGLFYYDETPAVSIVWGDKTTGSSRKGRIVVKDVFNKVVIEKEMIFNPARRVQLLSFPELKQRGVFSVTAYVPGLGKPDDAGNPTDVEEFCYFGTIPRFEREEGKRTPFGVTNLGDYDLSALAADLGFSYVRHFTSWNGIQPSPDRWNLAGLDNAVKNNNEAGLLPWIQLYSPPAWSLPEGMPKTAQFEPAPFDLKAWGAAITKLAERYKGKLYGFEFMNEIVPGKSCKDPVKEYLDICRVGHDAAKAVDPNLVCQLAGGLWPHSYRIDMLNAGVAKYVDVLPVHYSTFEGVREAQRDLEIRGIKNVAVADNETATGMTIWNMPPDMCFERSLGQCAYVMNRWPDELCAGAAFITYFGGGADACGNWSYMIDITAPRPVAATLAVVQGLIGYAKPIGKFYIGDTACYLFEKNGEAIVFLSTVNPSGINVKLPAKGALTVVDFQGNETVVEDGVVKTEGMDVVMKGGNTAGGMPVIVKGADLDALKMHAALFVGTATAPSSLPQVVADGGAHIAVPVTVSNPFADKREFTVASSAPAWGAAEPVTVALEPGESKTFEVAFSSKGKVTPSNKLAMDIACADASVTKPYILYVTDDSSLGNLVKNPGFDGEAPWTGEGEIVDAPVPGDAKNRAAAITGKGKGYKHYTETVDLPVPGATYLYSAWIRGEGMDGGSNLDEYAADGRHLRNHMMLRVFTYGSTEGKGWRYLSKKMVLVPETAKLAMTPVAEGAEGARIVYDNLQLTLYKDSDYVAFASGDAKNASPVPLLCDNLVRSENGYEWNEKNLAGVARFTWNADALVFEATVEDDQMDARPVVSASGEETLRGDSIALCIYPRIGPDGRPENDQLRWYISKASPGGGSGATTVFRPAAYSMGAKAGQLCKDSSVYQIDIKREGTTTTYRLVIPWAEIPGFSPAKGASFGCNVTLFDADGSDARGSMLWGGGLREDSTDCGLVTLTK